MEVVAAVCNRLIDFGIEEYGLLRNLREEAGSLRSTVRLIQGLLHDAGEKQAKDEGAAVRVWLGELKQVLFDAEDIIDEVATDAFLRRSNRDGTGQIKVRNIICFCFGRVERIPNDLGVAHRIQAIRLKLDLMYAEKNNLGLQISELRESRPAPRPPTSSLLADESYISGRDDEREKMVQLLLRSEEVIEPNVQKDSVQVLVVVGIGGVGKTTLAKLTFNDPRVKEHFQPLMMWVCVSEDFEVKRITTEIMEAALSPEERNELSGICNWDLKQRRFKNKMEDKRFLLVLDDMWEEDSHKWETLCEPLIHGAKGSKIIVTTRKQETLKMVKGIPFPLEVMSSEALWPVFKRYAFGNAELSEKMQLESVGRQIVKKLKGLPLAAKVIGRLLNKSLDINHWTNILKSEIFKLREYSSDILPVLKLSYDYLSMNLKQCFAYCSLFPKDYIFFEDELISLWMAQNFIQITRDLYAEQVGYEIIQDLRHQSFFELQEDDDLFDAYPYIVERSTNQFKMHDLIHDLAESISKDDCFRLGDDKQKQMSENVRHVSIATDSLDSSKLMEILNHENLRTLVFLHQNTFKLTPSLDDLFMKLKRLRVLGLRGCKIEKLPSSIGKLKHLRFVDLSKTLISNLPDSMSDLHNLQVLKLEGCRLLRALPRNTSALVNLRHLELDSNIASWVPGLGKLTALQELIVNGSKVGELAHMGMLKELLIWSLEGVASKEDAVRARLEAKEHLELLELEWGQSGDNRPRRHSVSEEEEVVDALKPVNGIRQLSVRCYEGARSPKWMEDLSWVSTSLLVKVVLRDCRKWEVLPPLSQLPSLKVLAISGMSGVRRIGPEFFSCCCCDDGEGGVKLAPGFPSLEELVFDDMPEWEEWEAPLVLLEQQQQPHPLFLPRLRKLRLKDCEKLRELPPLPPTLTTLRLEKVGLTRLPGWMERCSEDDIGRADVVIMPSTSSSSPYLLSTLEIEDCPNITSLDDGLQQRPLRMLKKLRIQHCRELASLPGGLFRNLDSLEELSVTYCRKLVSWPVPSAATEEDAQQLPSSLKTVKLYGCGDATGGFELLLLGGLQKLTNLTSLEVDVSSSDTLARLGRALITSTSLTHLGIFGRDDDHIDGGALSTCLQGLMITNNSLKSLSIYSCSAITTLPSSEAALRRLSALETLRIVDCGELRSLGAAAGLVSLKSLTIINCPKLLHLVEEGAAAAVMSSPSSAPSASSPVVVPSTVVVPKIISLETLGARSCSPKQSATWLRQVSSLQYLNIHSCPQLRCFGAGDDDINGGDLDLEGALLDLAPSLRQLSLGFCENLSSLPSKLRSLTRLETLWIEDCPKIQRLPSEGLPETLEEFFIYDCPELARRCREEGCPDWPLLSHIPHVDIGDPR